MIIAQIDDIDGKEGENRCITPFGSPGRCEDLSVCPSLLLNLSGLRDSLCFKRLFIPGVCCPIDDDDEEHHLTTKRYFIFLPIQNFFIYLFEMMPISDHKLL